MGIDEVNHSKCFVSGATGGSALGHGAAWQQSRAGRAHQPNGTLMSVSRWGDSELRYEAPSAVHGLVEDRFWLSQSASYRVIRSS
ncbi:hypothetical protein V8C44DRAFT_326464 [Trichoderma aethiopicum]